MANDNTPTVTARRRTLDSNGWLRRESAHKSKLVALKTKLRKDQLRKERHSEAAVQESRVPEVSRNTLQHPPKPKAKFRKRQKFKSWLPTHIFHAKRAHMTLPKEPLWRMALPLAPTQKCYRPTHRAASGNGGVAWDMSYMSTIGLAGQEMSIINVLKSLGVAKNYGDCWWTSKGLKWLSGTRFWEGWIFKLGTNLEELIAPVKIFWCRKYVSELCNRRQRRRQVFIHVHPSAFLHVWNDLLEASKVQKPVVSVEDLRFELGSIEVTGPGATEALVGTLWPATHNELQKEEASTPEQLWTKLGSLSSPAQLPTGAMLGFDITDPRLHHPPQRIETRLAPEDSEMLLNCIASWPIDQTQQPQILFDHQARVLASRKLPSQKSINRRKGLANKGQYPPSLPSDPEIPVIVLANKDNDSRSGAWTILLPWKCVLPIWYAMMFYPLSTGGTLRFGGLDQKRQLDFEKGKPWFPGDFPGTKAGLEWEMLQRKKRRDNWQAKPKGRRVEWESVTVGEGREGEVGDGLACDWEYICKSHQSALGTFDLPLKQFTKEQAQEILKRSASAPSSYIRLATVMITMLDHGVVNACARVYRLPTQDSTLRQRWEALIDGRDRVNARPKIAQKKPLKDDPAHERRQYLAAIILGHSEHKDDNFSNDHPYAPDEKDLIGFVTTGNFNLSEGYGTSIGSIALDQVTHAPRCSNSAADDFSRFRHFCIIRNSGQTSCTIAKWQLA